MSFSDIKGFDKFLETPNDVLAKQYLDHPEKYHKKITAIIRGVLDHPCDSPSEIKKGKAFLDKIEAINTKAKESDKDPPFKISAMILHRKFEKVISPKPTTSGSSSTHKLKGIFEKQTTESPVKPQPPTASIAKKKVVIIGAPITFAAIKDKIKSLDLSSRFDVLSGKINEIKGDLATLKGTGGINEEQVKALSEALDSLEHNSSAFKPSLYETLFIDYCATKNSALKKAKDEELPKIVEREHQNGRSEMLKTIIKSLDTPASLITTISERKKQLADELPRKRFHDLSVTNAPPFNKNFEKNLPEIIEACQKFSKNAFLHGLKKPWEAKLADFAELGTDFIEALQKHPSYDPAANYQHLLSIMQKQYFELFDLEKINESGTINTYLSSLAEPAKKQALGFFERVYNTHYLKKHFWFVQNYTNVEKAYDQSVEKDTNLGSGVCFSNCLGRTKQLLTNPALDSEDIVMGSTDATRVAHTLYRRKVDAIKKEKGIVTFEDTGKIETETAQRLGLKPTKRLSVPYDKDDPTKHIGTILEKAYKENGQKTSPILSLYAPGKGHAINVQMDKEDGQFRFLDDNLGICGKYESFEEFKEAFTNYLKAYYAEYTQFSLLFYSLST